MTSILDDPRIAVEGAFFGRRGRCAVCGHDLPDVVAVRIRSSLDKKPMMCIGCFAHHDHQFMRADVATAVATHFPKLVEYWHNQQQE